MIVNGKYILYTDGKLETLHKISQLQKIEVIKVSDSLIGMHFSQNCSDKEDAEDYKDYIQAILKRISNISGVLKIEKFTTSELSKKYHIENVEDILERLCGLNHGWGTYISFGDVIESARYELPLICTNCFEKFCEIADSLKLKYGDMVKIDKITQIDNTSDDWDELYQHIKKESTIEDIEIIRGYQLSELKKTEDLFIFRLKGIDALWSYNELTLIKKADKTIGMKEFINMTSNTKNL